MMCLAVRTRASWWARIRHWWRPASAYDEWTYWNSRTDPNAPSGLSGRGLDDDIAYIRTHVNGCTRILEFGPGVGRTFTAHTPDAGITCYDITPNYRDRLLARAQALGLRVRFDLAESLDAPLPYPDHAFDVAVASKVFLHQRPERIDRVMSELARVAGRVVAISTVDTGKLVPAPHCFYHDYAAICERIGCEIVHRQEHEGTLRFVYRRTPALNSR
jgi:SAM-dependent methyltransferase